MIEKINFKYGDTIDFGELKYRISTSFLQNMNQGKSNNEIFDLLEIKDPEKFCEECYGYKPIAKLKVCLPMVFPESKEEDYEALTRVAVALIRLWMEKNK